MPDLEARANRESQLQDLYDGVVSRMEEMRLILAEDLGHPESTVAMSVSVGEGRDHCYFHFGDNCTTGSKGEPGGALHTALKEARVIVDKKGK